MRKGREVARVDESIDTRRIGDEESDGRVKSWWCVVHNSIKGRKSVGNGGIGAATATIVGVIIGITTNGVEAPRIDDLKTLTKTD